MTKKRTSPPRRWVAMPSFSKEERKQMVETYARQHFLNDKVKDIQVKSRGESIYLYATIWNDYREVWQEEQIARFGWMEADTYILAYFRHTGKWQDILNLQGSLEECLEWVRENQYGLFWVW